MDDSRMAKISDYAGVVYRRGVIFTLGVLIGVTAACGEERLSPWAFFGTAVLWPVALGYALVTADFEDDPPPICHAPTSAARP